MDDGGRAKEEAMALVREMRSFTGKVYLIPEEDLEGLGVEALRELRRFVRDAEFEGQMRARKAQLQPWRRP